MSTRDDAIQRVSRKIGDIGSGTLGSSNVMLSDTEIGEEVDAAVAQYSQDRPLEYIKDLTGITSPYIAHTSLTNWVTGFSRLISLEPQAGVVAASYSPTLLGNLDVSVEQDYATASAHYLWLKTITPAASDTLRFRYTVPHTLSGSADTIPALDFDAVCDLAASYCCVRLAANASASTDSTIAADSVNYRDSQLRFKQTSEQFRAQYAQKIGAPADGGPVGASVTAAWDLKDSLGLPYMFHRTGWRRF